MNIISGISSSLLSQTVLCSTPLQTQKTFTSLSIQESKLIGSTANIRPQRHIKKPAIHDPTTIKESASSSLLESLILSTILCLLAGCSFNDSYVGARDGTIGPGDGGPDGGPIVDASSDANDDSGAGYPSDHIPTQSLPTDGQTLPPARAFMSWQDGVIPGGNSTWYRSCYTAVGLADIDDADECPNETIDTNRFRVIDPLTPSQSYFWKVQTCYDAGGTDCTDYSPVRSFSTDNSLLGWWRMDNGAGSSATDSSSAGNNGVLTNFDLASAWVPGFIGGALTFDGTDDFVELGDILNFDASSPFTISAWTNRQAVGSDHTIFARADYTDPVLQRGYWFGFSSTDTLDLFLVSDSSTGNRLRIDSTTLFNSPGTPHHVAVTYDGSTMASGAKLFVDGTEETVMVVSDALAGTTLNPAPTRIGGSIDTTGMPSASLYNFDGIIDDVTVYNRALTAQEIVNETCAREALTGAGPFLLICN